MNVFAQFDSKGELKKQRSPVFVCKIVSRIVHMLNNDELYILKLTKIIFCSVLFYKRDKHASIHRSNICKCWTAAEIYNN